MSNIKASPLPEVRALSVKLRRDLCPIVVCPCGSTVQLTYHDPRGIGRMLHDLCPSCGSDVFLDVWHYVDAYICATRRAILSGDEMRATAFARASVQFDRRNRAAILARS